MCDASAILRASIGARFRKRTARTRAYVRAVGDRDFDFWIGRWRVRWGDGAEGTNVVSKIFDGRVIVEQFDGRPGIGLQGLSVSVYDATEGAWRQTWVDSDGNYIPFTGGMRGNAMDLRGDRAGEPVRMLWRDIRPDSLRWLWERSPNGGSSWETLWELRYERLRDDLVPR